MRYANSRCQNETCYVIKLKERERESNRQACYLNQATQIIGNFEKSETKR